MKSTLIYAAIAAGVQAQAAGKCQKTTAIQTPKDPMVQFDPKDAQFPCDFGAAIPLGKVPQGCGKLEFIYGSSLDKISSQNNTYLQVRSSRNQ